MGREIFCRRCAFGITVIAGQLPDKCPGCLQSGRWTTASPILEGKPLPAYELTDDDVVFLKTQRIAVE
jgi:hypothetical protein